MARLIEATDLGRSFEVVIPRPGILGSIRNLVSRQMREVRAVEAVSFSVAPGEAVGFIGPNGAGKSTTIKMLTGILAPSRGVARVCGLDPHRERRALSQHIGVVFGQRTQLWWDLPVRDSFELLARIYRVPEAKARERLDRFRTMLKLDGFLDTPVRKLSLGQRMRADIVASLLHDPPLLILDEPTIGLDVEAKEAIREFLLKLRKEEGKTLLLTTHDLKDIEALCPRLIIIDKGTLLFDGDLESLRRRYLDTSHVTLEVEDAALARSALPAGIQVRELGTSRLHFELPRTVARPADVVAAVLKVTRVLELKVEDPGIEDVVRKFYKGDARA
ncbi:MAG: ATP-binding cassette domain-containing protein [Planctomycetota bacterium]